MAIPTVGAIRRRSGKQQLTTSRCEMDSGRRAATRPAEGSLGTFAYFLTSTPLARVPSLVSSPWPRAPQDEEIAGQNAEADPPFHTGFAAMAAQAQAVRT